MNPSNIVSLYGRVKEAPEFLSSCGKEFAANMCLCVKRNYRNKDGEYQEDNIPVKFKFDDGRKAFAHSIEAGDVIQVSGTIREETYKGKKLFYVLSDMISFDEMTRRRKYGKKEGDTKVSADFDLDLPLPFD